MPAYLSEMGYCGYGTFRDVSSSLSNPTAGSLPSSAAVAEGNILTATYNNPGLVAQQCMPHLVEDIAMLFALGCALRIATYIFLACKGSRK